MILSTFLYWKAKSLILVKEPLFRKILTSHHHDLSTNKTLKQQIGYSQMDIIPLVIEILNLLKPTGHVMHQQFNIQQLYVLPTLYLCVLYLSENKQRLVPLTA